LYYKYGLQAFIEYDFLDEFVINNYLRLIRVFISGLIFFSTFLIIVSNNSIKRRLILNCILIYNLVSIMFLKYDFNGSRRTIISIFICVIIYNYFNRTIKFKKIFFGLVLIISSLLVYQTYRTGLKRQDFHDNKSLVAAETNNFLKEVVFTRSSCYDTALQICDASLKIVSKRNDESLILFYFKSIFKINTDNGSEDSIMSLKLNLRNNYFEKNHTSDLSGFPFFYYLVDFGFFGVLIYFLQLSTCLFLFNIFSKRFINIYFSIFLVGWLLPTLSATEASGIYLLISIRNLLIFYFVFLLINKIPYVKNNYSYRR